MLTVVCPIEGCQMMREDTVAARKAHCTVHHGYPVCMTCQREIRNVHVFEQHLQQDHEMEACPLCFALIVKTTLKAHLTSHHGYPVCASCGRRNLMNASNFVTHMQTHYPVKCLLQGCETMLPTQTPVEVAHYKQVHGYPQCPQCQKTYSHIHTFVAHMQTHSPVKCSIQGCKTMLPTHTPVEAAHYQEVHGYPQCPQCAKVLSSYFNFSSHVALCGQARSSTSVVVVPACVYPGCSGLSTMSHLAQEHDGLKCTNCEEVKATIHTLAKHVVLCFRKSTPKHVCRQCHGVFPTARVLRHHTCLPPTPAHIHVNDYLRLTEQHCTQLEVCNQRDNSTYHVTARIRRSTLCGTDIREYTTRQLQTLKLDQDPTALEVMEPGTLPLPVFFMPTHLHFELRMRMLYELEHYHPAYAFYLMLVYRVMSFCDSPTGMDIYYYQRLVETTPLPPGVPAECRHLLVTRARVKDMWNRARRHRHIKVFMYSLNGEKHVLRSQLRKIDEAVRAERRYRGECEDNWPYAVVEEGDEDVGVPVRERWPLLRREETSDDEMLDGLEVDEGKRCEAMDTTPRRRLTMKQMVEARRERYKRSREEAVEGVESDSTPSPQYMDSEEIPVAVSQAVSIPRRRREASAREVEWQQMLYYFFHNILRPLVRSGMVSRLQTLLQVREEFLDHPLYMVEDGPACTLPEHMQHFLTKLVKSELSDMADTSIQPNVRMPDACHTMDSESDSADE